MSDSPTYAVVSADEAKQVPYPYIYVNEDGTLRELHRAERDYLEESFDPCDGARPHVKNNFDARDGWGNLKGFCPRSLAPTNLPISDAPTSDPNPPKSKEEQIAWLKAKADDFDITENPDGTVVMTRRKPKQTSIFRRFANFFLQWIGHEI